MQEQHQEKELEKKKTKLPIEKNLKLVQNHNLMKEHEQEQNTVKDKY